MTFTAQEDSIEAGQPIELYRFAVGTELFHLTSAEDEVTVDAVTYTPAVMSRMSIGEGQNERLQILEVDIPGDHPFAQKYISLVPGSVATLTILRYHRTDVGQETVLLFTGRVRSVAFSSQGTRAKIACLPLQSGLGRSGPRYVYSGLCNHLLYDSRCKVVSGLHKFTADVSAISGATYTIAGLGVAKGSGWATGGFVQIGSLDFRLVLSHNGGGDDVRLILPFDPSLVAVGTEVDVFAGCDHSIATCKTKFDNVVNYGGYAFVPLKNPFKTGL